MIFDQGPSELPVATLRPREPRAWATVLARDLGAWIAARWHWLRPRTVPVLVAAMGMFWVLAAANYLTHQHDSAPVRVDVQLVGR